MEHQAVIDWGSPSSCKQISSIIEWAALWGGQPIVPSQRNHSARPGRYYQTEMLYLCSIYIHIYIKLFID